MNDELRSKTIEYYSGAEDLEQRILNYKATKPEILAYFQSKLCDLSTKYQSKIEAKKAKLKDKLATYNTRLSEASNSLRDEVAENLRLATSEYNACMNDYRSSGKAMYQQKALEKKAKYEGKASEKKAKYKAKIFELETAIRDTTTEISKEIAALQAELNQEQADLQSNIKNIDRFMVKVVNEMRMEHSSRQNFIISNADKLVIVKLVVNDCRCHYALPRLAGFKVLDGKVFAYFLGKEIELSSKSALEKDRLILDANCNQFDYTSIQEMLDSNHLTSWGSNVIINNISIGTTQSGVTQIGTGSIINGKVQIPHTQIENGWTYFV